MVSVTGRDRDVFRNRVSLANLSEDAETLTETRFLSLGDMVSATGSDRSIGGRMVFNLRGNFRSAITMCSETGFLLPSWLRCRNS